MRYQVEIHWHPKLYLHASSVTVFAPSKKIAELFVLLRDPQVCRAKAVPIGRPSIREACRELRSWFTGIDGRLAVQVLERNLASSLGYAQGHYDRAAGLSPRVSFDTYQEEDLYRSEGAVTHFLEDDGSSQNRWPPIA
jgi:hypothetical protein